MFGLSYVFVSLALSLYPLSKLHTGILPCSSPVGSDLPAVPEREY